MDGDWITTMRTGAVAAHSVSLLARGGFRKVAFVGLGNTARATLLCLTGLFPNRPFEVGLLRYKDQHEGFERRFAGNEELAFCEFGDVGEMAGWCDVLVSCVTAADSDLCPPECFGPGALLVPVHTRGFAECDLAFDKVFCDDEGHVGGFGYFGQFKPKLAEVADVVVRKHPGREGDDERIIAYNIGISLHDIYFASKIEEMASRGEGRRTIAMEKPLEKFWI